MNRMLMCLIIPLILFSIHLSANEAYEIYYDSDSNTFTNVYGIDQPIKLHIGVGEPKILSLASTDNKDIKLLKCFGGDLGTSVLVGYFYTYILDFKKKNIVGLIEYYDDYGQATDINKKPKWIFKKDSIEVSLYDEDKEEYEVLVFDLE